MRYVGPEDCQTIAFPYIHQHLSRGEPAPAYAEESTGLEELKKVLTLVQDDRYYPTLADKSSYVLCGIAGAQYFSNGNKRLGVVTLLLFLIVNRVELLVLPKKAYPELLLDQFPEHRWEENPYITGDFSLFLYNLAIVIGDRNRWGVDDFGALRKRVAVIFERLFRLAPDPQSPSS